MKIHSEIILGKGKIGVDAGQMVKKDTEEFSGTSYIAFFTLPEDRDYTVGEDILDKETTTPFTADRTTWLLFTSLASVEVVERALALAKTYFQEGK